MNTISKRLVIITSFCLSAVLCRAESAAPAMPTVATATQATMVQDTATSQGFRAKAMDKLRGLLGACKDKSAAVFNSAVAYVKRHPYKVAKTAVSAAVTIFVVYYLASQIDPFIDGVSAAIENFKRHFGENFDGNLGIHGFRTNCEFCDGGPIPDACAGMAQVLEDSLIESSGNIEFTSSDELGCCIKCIREEF